MRTNPTRFHFRSSPAAFTLVELLVVIVIVAALASMGFFGARRMIDTSRTTKTVAHLRQLQIANTSYATEHSGSYVKTFDGLAWTNGWCWNSEFLSCVGVTSVSSALPQIFRSGFSAPSARLAYNCSKVPNANGGSSYFWGNQTNLSLRIDHIQRPEITVAFVDSNDWWVSPDNWNAWKSAVHDKSGGPPAAVAYRNNGKAAAVTFSGSVVMLERKDLDSSSPAGKWRWWYDGNN